MDLLCSWLATGKLKYITLCFFTWLNSCFSAVMSSFVITAWKLGLYRKGLDKKQQIPSYRARLLTYAENVAKCYDSLANTVDILVAKNGYVWKLLFFGTALWISLMFGLVSCQVGSKIAEDPKLYISLIKQLWKAEMIKREFILPKA